MKGKNRGGIDIKPAHVSPGGVKEISVAAFKRKMEKIRRKPLGAVS